MIAVDQLLSLRLRSFPVVGEGRRAGSGRARPIRASGMEAGPAARRASEMEVGPAALGVGDGAWAVVGDDAHDSWRRGRGGGGGSSRGWKLAVLSRRRPHLLSTSSTISQGDGDGAVLLSQAEVGDARGVGEEIGRAHV